jgi:2-methylcitrate dehydratase PrpD
VTEKTEICKRFAEFSHNIGISAISSSTVSRAKLAVLDYISSLCAGVKYGQISPVIRSYTRGAGGTEQSSIIGLLRKYPAATAAMANGAIAHSVELDDGHRFGTCHPATVIIPAAMSVAEVVQCTGSDFLVSVIVGYEVMLRLATAINPGHWHRGFHTTGTCGAVGASATAAKILCLDEIKTMYAISMGALQGAGLQEMLYSNSMIKPLQTGKSALSGVISGQLAQLGARAPSTVFEGKLGFFRAMTDSVDSDYLIDKLGKTFEIEQTYFKFYPTCRHVHCSIDLISKIQNENQFSADMVKSVAVQTYTIAAKEVGGIKYPQNSDEAMFSIPYAVAVWLHTNRLTLNELGMQYLTRPDIKETAAKVRVEIDEQWDAQYPNARGATLVVQLKDGRVFKESCDLPAGEPEDANINEHLIEKYNDCTDGILTHENAQSLLEFILQAEHQKNIVFIAEVLRTVKV